MDHMRASRRLQIDCKVKKKEKEQHIETYQIPYEKTVQSIPFYNKRKRQLKYKSMMYNSKHEPSQSISQPPQSEKDIENPFDMDFPLAQMITNISVEPVFTDNKFTNFNPQHYPLNQTQKVKVVEQKFFPLQNYYNYIYALKSQEEIFKLAQVTQKKANQIIQKQNKKKGGKYVESLQDDRNKPLIKQTKRIKGDYESRFNPQGKRGSKYKDDELGPVYLEFRDGKHEVNPFSVKEAQREKILNQFSERYFMGK